MLAMAPVNGLERGPYCKDCLGHINLLAVGVLIFAAIAAVLALAIFL